MQPLEEQKAEAVHTKNYEKAKKLQDIIEKCLPLYKQIFDLEKQEAAAVANEEFVKAGKCIVCLYIYIYYK